MNKFFLKIICLFLLLSSCLIVPIQTNELLQEVFDQDDNWIKSNEKIENDGSYLQKFTNTEKPFESVIIHFNSEPANLTKKYKEPKTDLFSLFKKETPSAMRIMRELRLNDLKTQSPYCQYKLIHVFNLNDVIYEAYTPNTGPYKECYQISRLIKNDQGILVITHQKLFEKPTSTQQQVWINSLKEVHLS